MRKLVLANTKTKGADQLCHCGNPAADQSFCFHYIYMYSETPLLSKVETRIVFLQKKHQMSPPLRNKTIKTSLNKITNRNNAHFSSKQSSSYPVKISC